MLKNNGKTLYKEDSLLLGTMAVERGYVTREDVEEVLAMQQAKLGTLLVREKKLTQEQLDDLLLEQAIMRGDVTDTETLRKFERQKFRRGIAAVKNTLSEASAQCKSFNADLIAIRANSK
jgi:phage terminase Nu1 subunit (DNA packaging protein)